MHDFQRFGFSMGTGCHKQGEGQGCPSPREETSNTVEVTGRLTRISLSEKGLVRLQKHLYHLIRIAFDRDRDRDDAEPRAEVAREDRIRRDTRFRG